MVGPAGSALHTSPVPATLVASPTPSPSAPSDSGEWPAGGRFQDAGFADTSGLANRIYGQRIPPELAPSIFLFQRVASGGFQAELDFPAPIIQLHYYSPTDSGDDGDVDASHSLQVRYTVDLVLQPPSGVPAMVTLQPDGTTVVTRSGAPAGTSKTVIVGTRLIMSVPASLGVAADWTVQAVIRLQGDQPLNTAGGSTKLPATLSVATEPAMVGVMTGDNATGAEPLAGSAVLRTTQAGVQAADTQQLPAGGRPVSLRLEQGAKGIVAVVTLDSPPKPATTIAGQPVNQQELDLSLAPGVQDGLGVGRVTVTYPYPVCPTSPCPSAAVGDVQVGPVFFGTVPVTVSGNQVRFDFGGFKAFPPPSEKPQPTPSGELLGTFTKTIAVGAQDVLFIPMGGAPAEQPESMTVSIDGTNVSIKRASGAEAATGSVNPFSGYFFAANSTEMWSGWLGKAGWYARLQPSTAAPAAARIGSVQPADLNIPEQIDILAQYLWTEKNERLFGDETPALLKFAAIFGGGQFTDYGHPPDSFRHAVAQFLINGGTFSKDVIDKAFPNGFDPIVVTPPASPPFPLAGILPALSPQGAQWEIAVGMRILDRTGNGVRQLSPYVPGSALLAGQSGAVAGAGAAPGAIGSTAPTSSGGSGGGAIIAVVVAAVVVAAGAAFWLRRRRGAPGS